MENVDKRLLCFGKRKENNLQKVHSSSKPEFLDQSFFFFFFFPMMIASICSGKFLKNLLSNIKGTFYFLCDFQVSFCLFYEGLYFKREPFSNIQFFHDKFTNS